MERTLFLDEVSDEHLRMWNINLEVMKKGIQVQGEPDKSRQASDQDVDLPSQIMCMFNGMAMSITIL